MKSQELELGVFVSGFFLGILVANTPQIVTESKATGNWRETQSTSYPMPQNKLCQIAKLITVKVFNGNSWGSGVLISKQEPLKYSLITSGHVLDKEKEFFIVETPDGHKQSASILVRFDHGKQTGNDLAILQFDSPKIYKVATLGQWSKSEEVMAAGFPVNVNSSVKGSQGFICTRLGQVSRKLEQPMEQGYQLGYFITIRNGMSGGPLLNDKGKVVGINGMAEPAIFTNPDLYLYRDKTRVSESIELPPEQSLKLLANSSWAIPSDTIVYLSPRQLNLILRDY